MRMVLRFVLLFVLPSLVNAQSWMQVRPSSTHPVLFADSTRIGVDDSAAPQRNLLVSGNLEIGENDQEGDVTVEYGHVVGVSDTGLSVIAERNSLRLNSFTTLHNLRSDAQNIQVNVESHTGNAVLKLFAPNLKNNSCPTTDCIYPNTQPWNNPANHTGNATTEIVMDIHGDLYFQVTWPNNTFEMGSSTPPDSILAGKKLTPMILRSTHAEIPSSLPLSLSSFATSRCVSHCESACARYCSPDPQWSGHESLQTERIESSALKHRTLDPSLCTTATTFSSSSSSSNNYVGVDGVYDNFFGGQVNVLESFEGCVASSPCEVDCAVRCAGDEFEVMGLAQRRAFELTLAQDNIHLHPTFPTVDNDEHSPNIQIQPSLYGSTTLTISASHTQNTKQSYNTTLFQSTGEHSYGSLLTLSNSTTRSTTGNSSLVLSSLLNVCYGQNLGWLTSESSVVINGEILDGKGWDGRNGLGVPLGCDVNKTRVRDFVVRVGYDGQLRLEQSTRDANDAFQPQLLEPSLRIDHLHEFHTDSRLHTLADSYLDANLYVDEHSRMCNAPHLPNTECVSGLFVNVVSRKGAVVIDDGTATGVVRVNGTFENVFGASSGNVVVNVATASSSGTSHPAFFAIDMNSTTFWQSGNSKTAEFVVDLIASDASAISSYSLGLVEISKILVEWEVSGGFDTAHPDVSAAESYSMDVSADNSTWVNIADYSGMLCSSEPRVDVTVTKNISARFIRIQMRDRCGIDGTWPNQALYYGIREIRIFRDHSVQHAAFFVGGAISPSTSSNPSDFGNNYYGKVGINTADPTHTLMVNGSALFENREADFTGFEGASGHLDVEMVATVETKMLCSQIESKTQSLVLASGDMGHASCYQCITGTDAQDDLKRSTNIHFHPSLSGVVYIHGDSPRIKGGNYFNNAINELDVLNVTNLDLHIESAAVNASIHLVPAGVGSVHISALNHSAVSIDLEWPEDIPIGTIENGIGGMWPSQSYASFSDSFAQDEQNLVLWPAKRTEENGFGEGGGGGGEVVVDGFVSAGNFSGRNETGWESGNHPGLVIEDEVSPAIMSDWGSPLRLRTVSMNSDLNLEPDGTGHVVVGGETPLLRPAGPIREVVSPDLDIYYPKNISARWTFDGGVLVDDAVGVFVATTTSGNATFTDGRVGTDSLHFDGNTTLEFSNTITTSTLFTTLFSSSPSFTFGGWIRIRGNHGWLEQPGTLMDKQTVMSVNIGSTMFTSFGKAENMLFFGEVLAANNSVITAKGGVGAGPVGFDAVPHQQSTTSARKHQWYHVMVVVNTTATTTTTSGGNSSSSGGGGGGSFVEVNLFVDGKRVAVVGGVVNASLLGNSSSVGITLGSSRSTTNRTKSPFSGDLDDLCVWGHTALTSEQIHTVYNTRNMAQESLSPFANARKNALRVQSRSHAKNRITTGNLIIDHTNPTLTPRSPLTLTLSTQSLSSPLTLSPHGNGSLVLGHVTNATQALFGRSAREYAVLAANENRDLALRGSARVVLRPGEGVDGLSGGEGIVEVVSEDPKVTSTSKTRLAVVSPLLDGDNTTTSSNIYLNPTSANATSFHIAIGGDTPTVAAESSELVLNGTTGDIFLDVQKDAFVMIGGGITNSGTTTSPAISSGGKDLTIQTHSNAPIWILPNADGTLRLDSTTDAAYLRVLDMQVSGASSEDLTLESGTINGVSATGRGSLVLVPGGTENVHTNPANPPNGDYTADKVVQIVRGKDSASAALRSQTGRSLAVVTQSDSMPIKLSPNADGALLLASATVGSNGLATLPPSHTMKLVSREGELVLRAGDSVPSSFSAGDESSQLVLSANRVSIRSLSDATAPARAILEVSEGSTLTLATVATVANPTAVLDVQLSPHGSGGVVVGGEVPVICPKNNSLPLTLRSGVAQSLVLVYGSSDNAVDIAGMDASGTFGIGRGTDSVLSSGAGLDLTFASGTPNTGENGTNIVLAPNGEGKVLVSAASGVVEVDGSVSDLTVTTAAGTNILLQPTSAGAVIATTDIVSSPAGKDLTLRGRGPHQRVYLGVSADDEATSAANTHMVLIDRANSTDVPEIVSASHLMLMTTTSVNNDIVLEPHAKGRVVLSTETQGLNPVLASRPDSPKLVLQSTTSSTSSSTLANERDNDVVFVTPNGALVLDVIAEGDPSSDPTIRAATDRDLVIKTRTDGKHVYLSPNGDGVVVVGAGDAAQTPTLAPVEGSDLRVQKTTPDGGRNILLTPTGNGTVVINALNPTLAPQTEPAKSLRLRTLSNDTDIKFRPYGSGKTLIAGDSPTLQSTEGEALTLNGSTGWIVLNPASGAVSIGGEAYSIRSMHNQSFTLRTTSSSSAAVNINLLPSGSGVVTIGGTGDVTDIDLDGSGATGNNPTIRSAAASNDIRVVGGVSSGNVVLQGVSDSAIYIHSSTNSSTLRVGNGTVGGEMLLETIANASDVVFNTHGHGQVVVQGRDDAVVAATGRDLVLQTENDDQRVVFAPHGTGRVVANATVSSNDTLRVRAQPSSGSYYRNLREDHDYSAQSSSMRIKTDILYLIAGIDDFGATRTSSILQPQAGKDITLSTLTEDMDIRLEPNSLGRVRVGGNATSGSQGLPSAVIAAIDKPLTIASGNNGTGQVHDLSLKYGVNKALVIDSEATVTSLPSVDLILQTRKTNGNIKLNPAGTGRVIVGTSITSASESASYPEGLDGSGNDFTIRAGLHPNPADDNISPNNRHIYLNPVNDTRETWLDGVSATVQSTSGEDLILESACGVDPVTGDCTGKTDMGVVFKPYGTASVEIQGDLPTIEAATGDELTIRTTSYSGNIYLIPDGDGIVTVGGSRQLGLGTALVSSNSTADNTFLMQFRSSDHYLVVSPDQYFVVDTDKPTIKPKDGERLNILTYSDNKNIYITPNDTGVVYIGGDAPSIQTTLVRGLHRRDVSLQPIKDGRVAISNKHAIISSQPSTDLTLQTSTDSRHVLLTPAGVGSVIVGGDSPGVESMESSLQILQSSFRDTQTATSMGVILDTLDITFNTTGVVAVGGDAPTIESEPQLTLRTRRAYGSYGSSGTDTTNLELLMASDDGTLGQGAVFVDNRNPTIEAHHATASVKATKELWVVNLDGDIVLAHGNDVANRNCIEASVVAGRAEATSLGAAGTNFTIRTPSENQNIIIHPHGNGTVKIDATVQAVDGKDLYVSSGLNNDTNVRLVPEGDGSVLQVVTCTAGCADPTISAGTNQALKFKSYSDSSESSVVLDADLYVGSSGGTGSGVISSGTGKDLRVQGASNKDIVLSPGLGGGVKLKSTAEFGPAPHESAVEGLWVRSGTSDELRVVTGTGEPVIMTNSSITGDIGADLRLTGKDLLLGRTQANVRTILGGSTPTLVGSSTIGSGSVYVRAGDIVADETTTTESGLSIVFGHRVVVGASAITNDGAATRFLHFNTGGVTSISDIPIKDITMSLSSGTLIVGGDDPTIASEVYETSGSLTNFTVKAATGSNSNVEISPHGSGIVRLEPSSSFTESTVVGSSLTVKGTSNLANLEENLIVGPDLDTTAFALEVVSDASSTYVVGDSSEDGNMRFVGVGPSPNVVLSPVGPTGVLVLGDANTNTTLDGDTIAVAAPTGSPLTVGNVRKTGDINLLSGSGVVFVGSATSIATGNEQTIAGDETSQKLTVVGGLTRGSVNAPITLGCSDSNTTTTTVDATNALRSLATSDGIVEVAVTEAGEATDSTGAFGIASRSKRSLTLATQTDGMGISLEPHGLGSVVVDGLLQLPVVSSTTVVTCTTADSDNGKMWFTDNLIKVCFGGVVKTMKTA